MTSTEVLLRAARDHRDLREKIKETIKPYGISVSQWTVLGMIAENPNIRISDMAKKGDTSMAFVTTICNLLEYKGLVKRGKGFDQRSKSITATCPWFAAAEKEIQKSL